MAQLVLTLAGGVLGGGIAGGLRQSLFERTDGYLRFIRHCMSIAKAAGGVDGFVVGSEMVALNRIRDGSGNYPSVPFWQQIASEAKARLGSDCIITYAADWSEYRYHDRGGANVDFPLDAVWADPNIDVVGIGAYFPLTDIPRAVYDKAAIAAGWASGELIDYFYAAQADRDLERRGFDPQRSPIDDPFWAIKDIRTSWENQHVPRIAGVPTGPATASLPGRRGAGTALTSSRSSLTMACCRASPTSGCSPAATQLLSATR